MDTNLAWMHGVIRYSEFKREVSLLSEYFRKIGADVELYKYVKTWFKRMNEYTEKRKELNWNIILFLQDSKK